MCRLFAFLFPRSISTADKIRQIEVYWGLINRLPTPVKGA